MHIEWSKQKPDERFDLTSQWLCFLIFSLDAHGDIASRIKNNNTSWGSVTPHTLKLRYGECHTSPH